MSSKRELILQNVFDTLQTITVDNGYEIDIRRVARVPSAPFDNPLFPCLMIYDHGEDKEQGDPVQFTNCILHIEIIFWNDQFIDASTRAGQIQASIEKALGLDTNRGGLAVYTHVMSNSFLLDEEVFPIGGGAVKFDIQYRHKLYDPYT